MPRMCSIGVVLVSVVLMGSALAGCVDMGEVEAMRNQAAQLRDELHAESSAWEQRLAGLKPGDPLRADARAALDSARAKEAAVSAAVSAADATLARAKDPDDTLTQAAKGLSPLIPEPARTPLVLGAALAATLLRASQLKRGLASVAQGIQKAQEEDEQFRARFKAHANTFRTIQTRVAKRVIDEATGDRPMLRLPV
jgi:hypothetical protein